MKRLSLSILASLTLGFVLGTTGCASLRKPVPAHSGPPTYALIVTMSDGQPPTAAQLAYVQDKFSQLMATRGMVFVPNVAQADQILRVEFIPDASDPAFGVAIVTGMTPNPLTYASINRGSARAYYPPTYGTTYYPGSSIYSNASYGYIYPYPTDVYYPSNPSVTPPSGTPPDKGPPHTRPHPNPTDPPRHPPGTGDRPKPPTDVVGTAPRPAPPPHNNRPPYSRPQPDYSPPASSSTSSSSSYDSGSSSSSSSSSSYSPPAYSPPMETSSSSSSSSSDNFVRGSREQPN